jgi:hypothetical protein
VAERELVAHDNPPAKAPRRPISIHVCAWCRSSSPLAVRANEGSLKLDLPIRSLGRAP